MVQYARDNSQHIIMFTVKKKIASFRFIRTLHVLVISKIIANNMHLHD